MEQLIDAAPLLDLVPLARGDEMQKGVGHTVQGCSIHDEGIDELVTVLGKELAEGFREAMVLGHV